MERGGFMAALLLYLIVAGVADASKGANFRAPMAEGKGEEKFISPKISPTPEPSPKMGPFDKIKRHLSSKTSESPQDADKSYRTNPAIPPVLGSSAAAPGPLSVVEGKSPQSPKIGGLDRMDGVPQGSKGYTPSISPTDAIQKAICASSLEKCVADDLVACLEQESEELFLLVQNGGKVDLIVNITITTSGHTDVKLLQLAKHDAEKISASANSAEVIRLILNAGKGDCILYIRPSVSDWNVFHQLPIGFNQIYAACLLFLIVVITGGTWACCKLQKSSRRGNAGVPYQQLEMGTLTDSGATNGWDQDWDNDWDEEMPSATDNLTSRSPRKDRGDWDD